MLQYCPTHGRFCNHKRMKKDAFFFRFPEKKTVTMISGFLGSGKTTLINHLIAQPLDKKVDVLVREYGAVAVDDTLLNMDKSRIHTFSGTSMHESKEEMLGHYLERIYDTEGQHYFDHLLVEASGAENAERLLKIFMQPNLRELYEMTGFVTVVDAKYGHLNLDEFSIAGEQLAFADLVVINKEELVDNEELESLKARIRRINPCAEILSTSYGELDYSRLDCAGVYRQLNQLDSVNAAQEGSSMDEIKSISLTADAPLAKEKVDLWIRELFDKYGEKILRAKGFFYLDGSDYIFEFQSVRTSFHSKTERKWKETEKPGSVVVLIGSELPDAVQLQESLNACTA